MKEMNSESRSAHRVLTAMTAFEDQEEGFALTKHAIRPGEIVFADPEFWQGKQWERMEIVKALRGTMPICVERQEFLRCTQAAQNV
jgi:hypothetical protein